MYSSNSTFVFAGQCYDSAGAMADVPAPGSAAARAKLKEERRLARSNRGVAQPRLDHVLPTRLMASEIEWTSSRVISMPGLGRWGQWGNQVFQYVFLRAMARAHECQMAIPPDWPPMRASLLQGPFSETPLATWCKEYISHAPVVADRPVLSHPNFRKFAEIHDPLCSILAQSSASDSGQGADGGESSKRAKLSGRDIRRLLPQVNAESLKADHGRDRGAWYSTLVSSVAGADGDDTRNSAAGFTGNHLSPLLRQQLVVQLWGWFQFHTSAYLPLKDDFLKWLSPRCDIRADLHSVLASVVGPRQLIGLHLRLVVCLCDVSKGDCTCGLHFWTQSVSSRSPASVKHGHDEATANNNTAASDVDQSFQDSEKPSLDQLPSHEPVTLASSPYTAPTKGLYSKWLSDNSAHVRRDDCVILLCGDDLQRAHKWLGGETAGHRVLTAEDICRLAVEGGQAVGSASALATEGRETSALAAAAKRLRDLPPWFLDWTLLTYCDKMLACNSTFSFTAAMVADSLGGSFRSQYRDQSSPPKSSCGHGGHTSAGVSPGPGTASDSASVPAVTSAEHSEHVDICRFWRVSCDGSNLVPFAPWNDVPLLTK